MYVGKEYKEIERQLKKYMAKMEWYKGGGKENGELHIDANERDSAAEYTAPVGNLHTSRTVKDDERDSAAKYSSPMEADTGIEQNVIDGGNTFIKRTYTKESTSEDNERDSAAEYIAPESLTVEGKGIMDDCRRDSAAKYPSSPSWSWRSKLHGCRRSSSFSHRRVKGMDFSTIVQVPSSRGGRLMKELVRKESQFAKLTGYNVQVIEKSGTQLALLFQRVYTPRVCHWTDCPACAYTENKPSKCRINNVVYEAVCIECEEAAEAEKDKKVKAAGHLQKDPESIWMELGIVSLTILQLNIG